MRQILGIYRLVKTADEVARSKEDPTQKGIRGYVLERPATKLRRYTNDFYPGGEWEKATNEKFPILMFICPNTRQLIAAKRYARRLLARAERPKDLRIRFTTVDEVREQGVLGEIWEVA
jgi:hypothetical protein